MPSSMPRRSRSGLVTNRSSPTSLDLAAQRLGQLLPAVPVVLGAAVLDRDDRIAADQLLVVLHHARRIERLALAGQHVFAVVEELAGRRIEREGDVLARSVAGLLAGLGDEAQRLVGRFQVGRETALVADIGAVPGVVQALLQGWKISEPMRMPSATVPAPTGMIMNSWMSIGLSACLPPLTMFIIGTGRVRA